MSAHKFDRSLSKDDTGASEVLGDILLVVMSVIMLSALAAQLLSMPAPVGLITADTVASFDGKNLTIEHLGGNPLKDPNIAIQVGKGAVAPTSYNIASGNGDGVLGVGENWKRDISALVTPDDTVYVAIIDTKNDRVISEQYVKKGQDFGLLPDIGLTVADISFWRNGQLIDDGPNAPMIAENLTINITVHNYGKVNVTNVQVATSVYMFSSSALQQISIPTLNASGYAQDNKTVSVNWSIQDWGPHTIYVRVIPLYNESLFTNNYAKKVVRVGPGIITPYAPDLNVTALYFSNNHPQHGDTVKIFVRIANQGGIPANVSLTYWDISNAIFTDINISVSSGQLLEVSTLWIPTLGGLHTMMANVSVTNGPPDDANLLNNNRTVVLEVLPTIMLVDDDHAGEGGLKDSVTSMRAALRSVGAQYTYYSVGGGDGPQFNVGPLRKRMMDFDLVIWMTGYEKSSTLTSNDVSNITRYMKANGKVWLIGQDLVDDLKATNNAFLTNYIHVQSNVLDGGSADPLEGCTGNNVTDPFSISMNPKPWTSGLSDRADAITADSKAVGAFYNSTSGANNSLMFNATTNGTPSTQTYMMAFYAFEFSQIASANDRTILTYEMLNWFGALARWGRDLALADQVLATLTPAFMDDVNITVYLRNNGAENEPVGSDKVQVLFMMDGSPIPAYKVWLNGTLQNASMTTNPVEVPNVTAYGGQVRVTMTWVANKVGPHTIRVMADPYDFIEEVDEDNNELWGASTSKITVRYGLLVVDDDDSPNNRMGATNFNSTGVLTATLDRLGYRYTTYVVPSGAADGPNETYLERFNSVIWLTGQCAPVGTTPITTNDETAIKGYLSAGDNRGFWLVGQDAYQTGAYGVGSFVYDYMHVQGVSRNQNTPNPLYGVKNDTIGHGINYSTALTFLPANGGSVLTPRADANGITYANAATGTFNAVRYDSNTLGTKVVYTGWELSAIAAKGGVPDTEFETELSYMVLHWFGMPETRTELRVTQVDMYYANMIPMAFMNPGMGNSYVAKAIIKNIGGTRGDCTVRFSDGATVIGSTFSSIGADGLTIAEIVWTPLFAGSRTISVWVDPDNTVPEIFKFNDLAALGLRSYFFYDDMENGTRNWKHEATILRINGESALEYLDTGNVSTNIISAWHGLYGFQKALDDYHSMNSSFKLKEPGAPLDCVLVFDTSSSMNGQPLTDEINAANTLVSMLTNDSRVAIYHAQSSDVQRRHLTYTTLNAAGRTTVTNSINSLTTQSYTQLWLVTGEAMEYCWNNRQADRVPAVVALTDGCDFQGSDTGIATPPAEGDFAKCEQGSNNGFAPWINWGTTDNFKNPGHWGKYFGDATTAGYWHCCNFTGGGSDVKGLLNAPMTVYTIGLNLEHDDNIPNFAQAGSVAERQRTGSYYVGVGDQYFESGTPEYNMYRVATTSKQGKYFYAPTSDELQGVFEQVAEELGSLTVARSARAEDGPQVEAAPVSENGATASGRGVNVPGTNDNWALTTSFSLQGVQTAKLSFWHKYNLKMGYSGGVVLVGTSQDNTTFNYKYMTPAQSYTGNIRMDVTPVDDFNNEIRWCWNGVSGNGVYGWEYVEVDLAQFCGQQYVRVMFDYVRAGGGGGRGWYIDDVEVKVGRSNSAAVLTTSSDQWELVKKGDVLGTGGDNADVYAGEYAWLCHNPSASIDYLKPGIDNSLITIPIDLTNALDATLLASFKFNINYSEGRPPDGFRVEVSNDNGVVWRPLNYGVRAAWKVSGSEGAGPDGKSFTGVNLGSSWVSSTSLSRVNCDLTGWAGTVIQLRFRVVTRNDAVNHFDTVSGFGGFYVDNVMVFGNTTTGGRSAPEGRTAQGTAPAAPDAQAGGASFTAPAVPGFVPAYDSITSAMSAVPRTERMALAASAPKGGELQ